MASNSDGSGEVAMGVGSQSRLSQNGYGNYKRQFCKLLDSNKHAVRVDKMASALNPPSKAVYILEEAEGLICGLMRETFPCDAAEASRP